MNVENIDTVDMYFDIIICDILDSRNCILLYRPLTFLVYGR